MRTVGRTTKCHKYLTPAAEIDIAISCKRHEQLLGSKQDLCKIILKESTATPVHTSKLNAHLTFLSPSKKPKKQLQLLIKPAINTKQAILP